ncbi:acyl-CoA synthetase (NDP forming) [Thermocatellispora tengchongensis]|uniref:Acyl-CoA synthetase (NDP forming) n=1 Tax=Thermocatellispora tengchongensis TaxID=1073253 RepID=A0A840PFV1_9ACTN|nr:acetate--CoA ligase family protein [Thermocatellispora tengchongensis]MBB5136823.1 acyl-CoA synthetase (NDP forming) [Thermocatellispora tengchongensis]
MSDPATTTADPPTAPLDWATRLAAMWDTPAVTLLGANERGGTTRLILDSLQDPRCPFQGRINVVGRRGGTVFGIPAATSLAEVDGEIGLLWLLVRGELVLPALRETEDRPPRGAIVFANGFREAGNIAAERELAAWARRHGVPLFGPQSVGVASFRHGLNALDLPIGPAPEPGDVAVLSQSGGLLGLILRGLRRSGLGVHSAYSLGNEALLGYASLGESLLADDDVSVLAVYAENVSSVPEFARFARAAAEHGKPVVLLLGGLSDAGASMARSHTGALATPERLVRGVCEQYGVVMVADPDELVASVAALKSASCRRLGAAGVGLFTGTGGGAIILADAMSAAGVDLPQPAEGGHANPLDMGAGLIGRPDHYREVVSSFARDPGFDIVVNVIPFIPTDADPPSFTWQLQESIRIVRESGKHPVAASLRIEDPAGDAFGPDVTIGYGVHDTLVKLRALRTWSRGEPGPEPPAGSRAAGGPTRVASAAETRELLAPVPLSWPATWTIGLEQDAAEAVREVRFPVVAKAETGSAHRAKEGAVVTHVPGPQAAVAAIGYLRALFGAAVTLAEFVPHDEEYFVGLSRAPGGAPLVAIGPGGSGVEDKDVGLRLLPLSPRQLAALLRRHLPQAAGDGGFGEVAAGDGGFGELIAALERVMRDPRVESIDLNPIVRAAGGELTVLDAKIHLYA